MGKHTEGQFKDWEQLFPFPSGILFNKGERENTVEKEAEDEKEVKKKDE